MMTATEIYYRRDFKARVKMTDSAGRPADLRLLGADISLLFWTTSPLRSYAVQWPGDSCTLDDTGDTLTVAFDSHSLPPGPLRCEVELRLPDGTFPDASQRLSAVIESGIRLVDTPVPLPDTATIEAILPHVYFDAWTLAVKYAGYTGTLQEYTDYARRFPEVVEQADTLSRMLSDFSDGKRAVVDSLAGHGVELAADPSFAAIAEAIRTLRLAVEHMPGFVDQSWNGRIQAYDLLNELRNHPHPDYPYRCGIRTSAPSVVLSQASAYLCSDGFFTTEQGVEHTFEDDMPEHYVIYYFEGADYTAPAYAGLLQEVVALNGRPRFPTPTGSVIYSMRSYSEEKYELEMPPTITSNSARHLTMPGVTRISRTGTFVSSTSLCTIQFPDLEEIKTDNTGFFANIPHAAVFSFPKLRVANGSLVRNVAAGSRWLFPKLESAACVTYTDGPSSLSLPELVRTTGSNYPLATSNPNITSIEVPKLETVNGGICAHCSGMTSLSLPSLKEITGGTNLVDNCVRFESIDMPVLERMTNGLVIRSCPLFTTLTLPALTTVSGGTLVSSCAAFTTLELPALTTVSGGTLVSGCAAFTTLELPALTTVSNGVLANNCANLDHINLPALESFSATLGTNLIIPFTQTFNSINAPKLRKISTSSHVHQFGTFKGESITLPALESASGGNTNCALFYSAENLRHIYVPACTVWNLSPAYTGTKESVVIHFGRIELGTITVYDAFGTLCGVELGTGSRTSINLSFCPNIPAEYLRGIINALADNSGFSPTLALKFGATNLDKLTDEEKAVAVAKNYSLS